MARKTRTQASRSERRVARERAGRAREHGLPAAKPPERRAALPVTEAGSGSDSEPGPGALEPNRRMPLFVKLLGIGLLLLGAVYAAATLRDRSASEPETHDNASPESAVAAPSVPAEKPGVALATSSALPPNPSAAAELAPAAAAALTVPELPKAPAPPVPSVGEPALPKALQLPAPRVNAVKEPSKPIGPAQASPILPPRITVAPVAPPAAPVAPAKPAPPRAPDNPY